MLTVGRARRWPPSWRASTPRRRIGERSLALVLVAVLLSALATEFIGIHAIFGAFLLGAIIPHDSRARAARHRTPAGHRAASCSCRRSSPSPACARRSASLRRSTTGSCAASSSSSPRPGKFGGTAAGGAARRARLARQRGARRPDEHARPGRADRPQHRPRPGRDHARAVHDAGHHGARHDDDDVADPVAAARSRPWSS